MKQCHIERSEVWNPGIGVVLIRESFGEINIAVGNVNMLAL
jgi:hypothetical protein